MPKEMRKHGISYFILVRQKWESGTALTPSSSRVNDRARSPAAGFQSSSSRAQLPAPYSLVMSTQNFCPSKALSEPIAVRRMCFTSVMG